MKGLKAAPVNRPFGLHISQTYPQHPLGASKTKSTKRNIPRAVCCLSVRSHSVLGRSLPASASAFGCHEGRKLLSHCSSSGTALCSGADLPQTSFSRFWSPYIKKLWQPSLSCQQVPENQQQRGASRWGWLPLFGSWGGGVARAHRGALRPAPCSSPHLPPTTWLTSLCTCGVKRVRSGLVADHEPPKKEPSTCVSAPPARAGGGSRPGPPGRVVLAC